MLRCSVLIDRPSNYCLPHAYIEDSWVVWLTGLLDDSSSDRIVYFPAVQSWDCRRNKYQFQLVGINVFAGVETRQYVGLR